MKKNIKNRNLEMLVLMLLCFVSILIIFMVITNSISRNEFVQSEIETYKYFSNNKIEDVTYLSNINYVANQSFTKWDKIRYDEAGNGKKITIKIENNNFTFDKGIWAHATSQVTYDISNLNYMYFTAFIGLNTTAASSSNGVKFSILTSKDGQQWEEKISNKLKRPGENADFIQINISDVKYLRLVANDNGANGNDHAVYADAKLVNKVDETSNFTSVEEYNNIIKTKYANQYDITGEFEFTLLKRELIKNVGQFTMNSFYNSSDENKKTIDWLMNNQDILRYYILGGKPDGGSYYNSLTELSRLYSKYKDDFKDATPTNNKWYPNLTKGEVYKKMAISLSLTHSTAVGYWAQINHPSNRSDSLVRYAIYKDLYDRGKFVVSSRQDHTPWFEALNIEEMRYVMNNITDDEELLWLNEYTQKRIDAHPNEEEKYLQPHTYISYVWPNFDNPIFHDPDKKDYWDEKFEGIFSKYGVTYSTENSKVYKAWMSMRNEFGTGAVCGGISKLGTHIRAAHGTPASVISQPGHAAIIYYRKNADGKGYWTIDNDVSGWAQSGKTERLNIRMPLGWGNDSYVSGWAATYIILAQEAMNDWENYEKSEKLIMLADVYNDKAKNKEEILRKSLEIQPINIDVWWELIKLYNNDNSKTEEDYYKLAEEMGESLLPFPLPLYNLYNQLKGKFISSEYEFKFTLLQARVLNDEKNYTATDKVLQPAITRIVGNYLLGLTDTSLATFSFDGENAGKIILSNRFDGNGIRWDYSLDGKKTWKEVSFTAEQPHQFQLTQDEIDSITIDNDIYVHIVGLNYNEENLFKIDITKGTLPKTNYSDFLYGNNLENRVVGADSTMEWRYSEKDTWTSYAKSSPDLTGNKSVQVRVAATGTKVASDYVTFTFTEDDQPDTAKYIPIKHLTIHSFSTQSKDSGRPFYAPNVIDGNMNTLWHTDFAKDVRNDSVKPFITIKLDEPRNISALEFAQIKYKNGDPDAIKDVIVYVSSDGEDWIEAGRLEGCSQENKLRRINFDQSVYGQYVKVEMSTYSMFASLAMVNLFEDTTITTVGTFSFDGTNAQKIVLIDEYKGSTWEYSVDGGITWIRVTGDEKKLSFAELKEINEKDNIKIRIIKDKEIIESFIDIGKQNLPTMPNNLYVNDLENRLIGLLDVNKLEWKIDDGEWISYSEKEPNVIGTQKLYVRNRATGNIVASEALEYQFTEDNQPDTAKYIPINHLSVHDFSSETVRPGNQEHVSKAIDGNIYTKWHTSRTATNDEKFITIKLDEPRYISKIQYNKEDKYVWGVPKDGIIYTSMDGENWQEVLVFKDLYNPANKNALAVDVNQKDIVLNESVLAQYVKIKVTKSCDYVNGAANGVPYNYFFSSTMLNFFEDTTKNTKVAPTAEVKYSTKTYTNKDVVVTLVNPSKEITITNNDGKDTYIFTKNGTFTFEFEDKDGNKGTVEAVVDWIDKEEIKADIAYNINTKTNQDVTATIVFNKENVSVKGGNTHIFTKNGTYIFEYEDKVGNKGTAEAKVDWIDRKVPTATINYSITSPTNQDVVATITFDEENVKVTDGATHTFTNNGSYVFEFVDEAGNKGIAVAKVDWIDRTIPRAIITYNITKSTNQDVIATVTFDKENVTVEGGNTHTFTENGEYEFEFVGPAGNKGKVIAKVDWIDKKVPVATITYSPEHYTNQNVVATITFDKENVTVKEGNTHTFANNGSYVFEFVDEAGNKGTVEAKVDWIDRTLPKATIKYSKNELTNQDVIATITFDKENVIVKGGNTHIFTENGEYEYEFIGPAGNEGTAVAKVDWIDKKIPKATVTYSNIHKTNKNVIAKVNFEEENVTVKGGNTHIFTENGEYVFEFVDAAGNKGEAIAIVSWIDKKAPIAKVAYSTTEPTNKEVIATITFDKKVSFLTEDIYGEELSNNTYRFTILKNIDSVVEFVDELGNKGALRLKVDWIDKEAPTATIKYSKTTITTGKVIATLIDASEEITITNNDGRDTYTFTENGEFIFEFVDKVGNKGTAKAVVNNIDKNAAVVKIEYDTTNPTNKDVIATLVSESNIEITNNDGKNTYTFTENGEFTFEFIDLDGNKRTARAKVDNIDKKVPTATIISDSITPTNQDVVVTLVNPSEEITITNNDGKNKYTFVENGEFTFEYVDKVGNKGSSTIKVTNIDKVKPTARVEYSETDFTNKDVVVTLVDASEEIIITNNDGKDTYTFTENGEFTFEFVDKVGNKGKVVAIVRNINKKAPTAKIKYSTIEPTNQDVVVTLIEPSEEITITNNEGKDTYIFTENGKFTFEFTDKYGNKSSVVAVVSNIDKKAPKAEVKYSKIEETYDPVTATIIPSEKVTITNNGGKATYTFTKNGEFTFKYVDVAGNKGSTTVKVDWIKQKPTEAPKLNVTYSESKKTNQDVEVKLELEEGITVINNEGSNKYVFTENGEFTFKYVDKFGNEGTTKVKVDWIDKEAPTTEVSFSTTEETYDPVTATIIPSEKVTITNNNGKDTYTFTENGEFTFEYVDVAGNKGSKTVKVDWIKRKPTEVQKLKVTYSTIEKTSKPVTVTLELEEGITVTNNEGSNKYVFIANGEFTFKYVDKFGNEGSTIATVNWIDNIELKVEINYDITSITNQNVIATLKANKSINITNNNQSNSYTFAENGSFTFEYVDEYGNNGSIDAVVSWIDKISPTAEVSYSTLEETTDPVTVTIIPSEEVIITNNDGKNTYTFTENGEFTFEYVDIAGNKGNTTVKVDWIKEKTDVPVEEPIKEIEYSNSKPTNQDVTVTIMPSEGITITNNDGLNTYTFTENGIFVFEYVDKMGNTGKKEIKVDWIDKKVPTADVSYSTTEETYEPVTVTIKPSEEVTIINNDGKDTYTFTENGEFTFEYVDIAGNKGSTTVKVNTIKKVEYVDKTEIHENKPIVSVGNTMVDNYNDDSIKVEEIKSDDEDNEKILDDFLNKNEDKEEEKNLSEEEEKEDKKKLSKNDDKKLHIKGIVIEITIIFILLIIFIYLLLIKKSKDKTNSIEKTK